ncbi:ribonucleoside-diphosphate reductase large subunit [Staphylococcus phage vB_SscM-1]|uniref:Ribonucleotide reductase of class Ia (Aerobic) alpha subunit n=2 Tax=Sciuriunavirus SscM1 TaxID=2734053 RepID=A0A1X9I9V2_9CAUD|nr:ribonucleoside-diphosphate reductase large subunit [Staphylococcus phage vB_SscM-1]ANT44802.1 ribonucleotide reductase of class Ia (aerobic) alpha subunit [Staphylococcus phage vB_SscM-1]ANT45004.1 ribonucleotide reductase of class Ia (aerobic) alpha subunit [Staphylococcus phage vB_SscM-2]
MEQFEWLNTDSRVFLERGYLSEGETPEQRIRDIADTAEEILGIEGFSDKFYYYMGRGYYSLSSPVWSNFGKDRGLSISCFGSYTGDSIPSILGTASEVGVMSKFGGGTSGYFGKVRPRGSDITNNGKTSGSVHFMKLFEQMTDTISQGNTRRGRFSPYLPIDHPDIEEFLEIGTEGNPIQNMTHAVTVTDDWLQDMVNGDLEKRKIWAKVLTRRTQLGFPYIMFSDNANNNTVDVYKDKGMKINNSNLCSEIFLPNNEEESFVCCLSSMNLVHYEEWKDTDAVEVLTYFLDAVMSEFISDLEKMRDSEDIEKRESFRLMERAYNFSKRHRALGLGVLGWHSYLQSKMIPFESVEASRLNTQIFSFIKKKAYKASKELAELFGEPELLQGYGRRNSTLLALAPTTSSSFILGQVSKSIEPFMSNYYVVDTAKVKKTMINPYLKELLKEKGKDTKEVLESIRDYDGSVQHLDFLNQREKDVFKTYGEINQYNILDQAGSRQYYIDQGQSINIMVNPKHVTAEELNELYLFAWANGIKSLYYQHGTNSAQQFNLSKLCINCEA